MAPFAVNIDLNTGHIGPPARALTRRLSDLRGLFCDEAAYSALTAAGDPVVYEVYEVRVPEEDGHLLSCTTIIHPGQVGREYFFTKGHYHLSEPRAEIYTCLRGEGYLLLGNREGESRSIVMIPGVSAYIPPYWAHRTLNTGSHPFIFHGVWPGDSGHDYGSIEQAGFPLRVFEERGRPAVKASAGPC
ncbi:MAG TPA: glucose-6-phosphate isomerase [Clostridiales bacterium]|nr:glucose-6-phosphate isomerase [Clostridiales bacterium]